MGDLIRIKRVTVLLAFLALLSGLLRAQGEPGSRSAADVQRDLGSRPKEALDFFDPQPGWRIIDLFAGDGYYSELLHHRVGPRGRIYLHNSQATQPNPRLLRQRRPGPLPQPEEDLLARLCDTERALLQQVSPASAVGDPETVRSEVHGFLKQPVSQVYDHAARCNSHAIALDACADP